MSKDEDIERYQAAMHAMQSGVAMTMNYDAGPTSPKHLRVGVNSALIDIGALTKALIDKGVITEEEYFAALAFMAEEEVKRYEEELNGRFDGPVKITLQ